MSYQLPLEILRAYDIRGLVGVNLSNVEAFEIGQRFASTLSPGAKVCVGRDGRASSPALSHALIEGLTTQGIDVIDIGIGPTPMLYYGMQYLKTDAAIMVTGSHNPPDENGFKITLKNQPFFGESLRKLGTIVPSIPTLFGKVSTTSIQEHYCQQLHNAYHKAGRELQIVWDPGNGATAAVLTELVSSLPGEHHLINNTIDATFPAHHPDPLVPENLTQLIQEVQRRQAEIGIAFDGDGDRIGVVDNRGRILWGDQLMILYSQDVLERHKGATIMADVKASQALFDEITRLGGNPVMVRTGHSFIKAAMIQQKSILAGEMSGHIFFADEYYGFDDALYAALRLLRILSASPLTLAELYDQLPVFFNTPELRIPYPDNLKFALIDKVKNLLKENNLVEIDGLRVTTPEGWWLLRASNTASALVARCEAPTIEGLEILKETLKEKLAAVGIDAYSLNF